MLQTVSVVRILHTSSITLAIEDVAAKALAHSHAQVDIEANLGDADAGVVLVLGQQEGVIMVVVVRVARMAAGLRLRLRRHGGRGNVSYAVRRRGPVERQGLRARVVRSLCM